MSRIRGPRDKEYGQKNISEGGINPKSPKAKLEEIKALRAANRITSKIEKPKKTTSSINPRSPRARLEARKSLERANEITSKPVTTKKVTATTDTKPKTTAKTVTAKPKVDAKPKPTSFADAFRQAKGKKTFEFKGKKYARVTADEVKKAGFASLKDYLNAPRKTQIAKK
jgi:hypothetical protein